MLKHYDTTRDIYWYYLYLIDYYLGHVNISLIMCVCVCVSYPVVWSATICQTQKQKEFQCQGLWLNHDQFTNEFVKFFWKQKKLIKLLIMLKRQMRGHFWGFRGQGIPSNTLKNVYERAFCLFLVSLPIVLVISQN